jgi:hypothetical protein
MRFEYGDIICFKPSTLIGYLIVFFDGWYRGKYSHNAIFLEYFEDIPLFIEAHESNKRGIAIQRLEERGNYAVYRPISLQPRDKIEVLRLLNTKYDARRIWKILKHRLFGIKIPKDTPNEMICTEFVNFTYRNELIQPGYETPWELEKLVDSGRIECVYKS